MELIDKQMAINIAPKLIIALNGYEMHNQAVTDYCVEIMQLPPTQPEQRWIPCSERLPEVKQKVLVQYADESMATKRCNDAGHLQWFYSNAVAWMPAPEPYQQKEGVE